MTNNQTIDVTNDVAVSMITLIQAGPIRNPCSLTPAKMAIVTV
jgi:hypothetical protein